MAMRAAALKKIQGWDDCIGPGEKFGSGDDHNIAFRLLCAGYKLHFCPQGRVVHHGVRPLTYNEAGRTAVRPWIWSLLCQISEVRSFVLRRCQGAAIPFIKVWFSVALPPALRERAIYRGLALRFFRGLAATGE